MPDTVDPIFKEAGLDPSKWATADSAPIIPGRPAAPPVSALVPSVPQYSQGSIPPSFQHDASFVDIATTTPNAPKFSLMPLGINASPVSNASIQSTATKVVESTPAPSVASSISLTVPPIFAPVTQTIELPGTEAFSFSLITELAHTFLAAPIPGLTSLTGIFGNNHSPSPATNATITFTPPTAGWALYMESLAGNTNSNISGWTAWGDASALSISSASPVTATDTVSNSFSWCNIVATFSGTIPTFIANHQTPISLVTNTGSVTFSPTAGNFLIVSIYGTAGNSGNFSGVTVSDSRGDTFTKIATASAGPSSFNGPVTLNTYIVTGVVGGSTTVNCAITGTFPGGSSFTLSVSEVTPFSVGAGLPIFRSIDPTDLPTLSASNLSNGTTGTGAIVLASSPTLTGILAAGSQTLTGKITNYNSIATVSNGVPSEYVTSDLTAQSAAITATTLYAVPATGMYRISWSADITTADGVSSVLGGAGGFQVLYTSPTDSVVKTTVAQSDWTSAANTTGTAVGGIAVVYAKASTNIQFTFGYTSNTPGQMIYELHIKLEAM